MQEWTVTFLAYQSFHVVLFPTSHSFDVIGESSNYQGPHGAQHQLAKLARVPTPMARNLPYLLYWLSQYVCVTFRSYTVQ